VVVLPFPPFPPPPDIALQPWLAQAKEALELIPLLQGRIVALEGLEKRVKVVEDSQAGVPFLAKRVDYLQGWVIQQEGDFGQVRGQVADLKKREGTEERQAEEISKLKRSN